MRFSDKTLHGRTVISVDGIIGSISELFVSASEWRVESLRIELHNGANRTLDAVVLTVDVEQLCEAHRAPATDAAPSQPSP